jgi:hypothetical protein
MTESATYQAYEAERVGGARRRASALSPAERAAKRRAVLDTIAKVRAYIEAAIVAHPEATEGELAEARGELASAIATIERAARELGGLPLGKVAGEAARGLRRAIRPLTPRGALPLAFTPRTRGYGRAPRRRARTRVTRTIVASAADPPPGPQPGDGPPDRRPARHVLEAIADARRGRQ